MFHTTTKDAHVRAALGVRLYKRPAQLNWNVHVRENARCGQLNIHLRIIDNRPRKLTRFFPCARTPCPAGRKCLPW